MNHKKLISLFLCLVMVLSGCQTSDTEKAVNVWENGMEISGVTASDKSSLIEEKPAAEQHESSDSDASAVAKSIQNSVNDSMAQIVEAGFLKGYTYTYEPDKKAVDVITKSCSKTNDPTKCYVESVMSAKDELDNSGESADYSYTYKASSAVVKTVREGCEGAEDPTQCYIDLAMAKKQAMSVPEKSISSGTGSTAATAIPAKTNVNANVLKEGCEAADNPTQCYINQALAASVPSSSGQLASASSNTGESSASSGNSYTADSSKSSASSSTDKQGCEASDNPTQCYIDQANEKRASGTGSSSSGSKKQCDTGYYLFVCGDLTECIRNGVVPRCIGTVVEKKCPDGYYSYKCAGADAECYPENVHPKCLTDTGMSGDKIEEEVSFAPGSGSSEEDAVCADGYYLSDCGRNDTQCLPNGVVRNCINPCSSDPCSEACKASDKAKYDASGCESEVMFATCDILANDNAGNELIAPSLIPCKSGETVNCEQNGHSIAVKCGEAVTLDLRTVIAN